LSGFSENDEEFLFSKALLLFVVLTGGHSIAPKNSKRQRRKRQSVTAKPEKSQTPKFV